MYYECKGKGPPIVFIHGAFVDSEMWKSQKEYFSKLNAVYTYDIRGHGKTGKTEDKKYSVKLFTEDLRSFIQAHNIKTPIICGLSLGGMIAQVYAVDYPDELSSLILADTAVSLTLTWLDKFYRYVIGPKWLMLWTLRIIGVKNFIKFSFWMAKITRSKEWLGNEEIIEFEKQKMLQLPKKEYLKIFGALYDFKLQQLEKITVPTLVLNGEYELSSLFKHAEKMKELIPNCEIIVVPKAGHVINMENPDFFNNEISNFLQQSET
jgi:pimeloyl-ACP methyl ester carboxylesterase